MTQAIALVTGAGSGLGAAVASRLAASGALVVCNDLDDERARATADSLGGETAVFDVSDSAAFDAAVDDVVGRHGRLDVLVNNAGHADIREDIQERGLANAMARMTGGEIVPLEATSGLSDEDFDRMMRVHVYGTFHGLRAALRHMEPARAGSIVNLASIAGIGAFPGTPHYAAAKHAIVGLTRSVGHEVAGLGIRVNAVAPGFADTPLLGDLTDERKQYLSARIASGRLALADEVAAVVAFLASDEASYCCGEVFPVTGGWGG